MKVNCNVEYPDNLQQASAYDTQIAIVIFFTKMLCWHGCKLYLTIFITVLDLQTVFSIDLSRDTLRTINGNEVYEQGYYVRKRARPKQCYYSASSPVGLTRLARDEMNIYDALSEAKKCTTARYGNAFPQMVQEYLEDYEATSGALIRNQRLENVKNKAAAPAGDLIGSYRMVRRFRNYIQQNVLRALPSNISASCEPKFLKTLEKLPPTDDKGPFKRDFQLRVFAIIHTQLQFGWKPADISQGTIKGMELGTSLKAVHCIEIGVHAVATGFFPVGIEWLELAVTKIQNGDKTVDLKFVLSLLQKSVTEHDRHWQPKGSWDLKQVFYKARLNDTNNSQDREWPRQFETKGLVFAGEVYTDVSWDVCSGKIRQTVAEKSQLFCWHETHVHPTWKLGPLKVELLARQPLEILQFHQVLDDGTIQKLQDISWNQLETLSLYSFKDTLSPKLSFSEGLLVEHETTHVLTERIVGLKPDIPVIIPVVAYPPGGHIRTHVDVRLGKDFQQRVATVIYFLDAPEVGGETAFPAAKVLAKPIKGSAILFYSLFKSSRFNQDAKHRSCPVVRGLKWIGTRWVQYNGQWQLKCDLDENSMVEYLVNGKSKYNVL